MNIVHLLTLVIYSSENSEEAVKTFLSSLVSCIKSLKIKSQINIPSYLNATVEDKAAKDILRGIE